jgi:dicarboxylate transporter DctA-like protein
MRIVKTAIVLLLVLSGALLAIRFFFLDQTAVFILQKIGADEVRVHGLSVDFQQFHVDELAVTFNLPSGDRVQAEIHNISLQFDPQQLVTTGRGNRVDIEAMDVILNRRVERSETPMRLPEKIVLLKDSLRERLPLETITIKQVQFHGDLPPQFTEKKIQVNAVIRDTALNAMVTVQPSADMTVTVELQSPDSLHATAMLGIQKANSENVDVGLVLVPDKLSAEVDLRLQTLQDLFFQGDDGAVLSKISGFLTATLDIPLLAGDKGSITATAELTDFTAQGLSGSSARIQLAGRLEAGALVLGRESRFLAKRMSFGKMEIQEVSLDLAGEFKQINDQLLLHFTDQQKLEMKGMTAEKLQLVNLDLDLENPLHISIDKNNNSWSVADNVLHAGPLQIQMGTNTFESSPASCSFFGLEKSFPDPGLLAEIQIPTAVLGSKMQSMPLKELSGTLQLKQKNLSGKLQFSPESITGRVQTSFEHNLESATGRFALRTDKRFELNEEGGGLSSLVTSWQYPFDLDSGRLFLKADGTWGTPGKLQLSVFAALTGGSGYYKQFLFNGLEFRQDLAVFPELQSKTAGSFALQHLIGGLDVYDIRSHVNLLPSTAGKLPLLEIDDFSASLFDGTIRTSNILYDLNQPDSHFVVDIESMNLETLVNLIKMNSLQVTGRISGSIPVTIKGKEITVVDGELHSEEPGGEIRYLPGAMNQSGMAAYALKAVENMQYKTLTAKAGYVPSGQLGLDISLQGTSPGLQTRRPVHLNIHAEQNLPDLLQSLRFSKGLTEELDKRVKQHYN